jgi:hypothetical protein
MISTAEKLFYLLSYTLVDDSEERRHKKINTILAVTPIEIRPRCPDN